MTVFNICTDTRFINFIYAYIVLEKDWSQIYKFQNVS